MALRESQQGDGLNDAYIGSFIELTNWRNAVPNLNQILKAEIARVARRESKSMVQPLHRQLVELKKAVRAQRKRIEGIESQLARKAEKEARVLPSEEIDVERKVRVPEGSVLRQRERLGITQREMALLLGVSTVTVGNWETGIASPRGKNRLAFGELRKTGVKEVRERLEGEE